MKLVYVSWIALILCLPLGAQTAPTEEKEIPTEVSEPPYALGDLVVEQGYYIDRGEDLPRINLRIVDDKLRLYWIDQDGLIVEPEYSVATVRLSGSVRGRPYHRLKILPGGAGLASPGIIVPPHIYNMVLVFPSGEGEEPVTYTFRYTPSMDVAVDPTVDSDS